MMSFYYQYNSTNGSCGSYCSVVACNSDAIKNINNVSVIRGQVVSGAYAFIGGGGCNTVQGNYSSVLGGSQNQICQSSFAAISGGQSNFIDRNSNGSSIVSGTQNCLCNNNYVAGCLQANSIIGSGNLNLICCGSCSGILGGANNIINSGYSFIGGGEANTLQGLASLITGGQSNQVSGACSAIVGGCANTVSGSYSAILGGSGNNDNGHNWAGIFGCGITAGADKTFHVNCMNAINTPLYPGGGASYPSGTIFRAIPPNLPPAAHCYPLYIWL